ncbi:MAG: cytochrome P450 [Microcella sp.]|uniref:cytochrome P450 n=1 Tax=Microcella sp. TaxID=1913979 RepID=UPI0024C920B9|nr:cytochrome P450 [Microcella sp.]UYN83563.1 MAG: cytochrome P450 [Microcella sp.]
MVLQQTHADSTLAFLMEGYRFGQRRFDRFEADAFRTRIALRPATLMRGPSAARFFYSDDNFTRAGAMPPTTKRLLQDEGSVQSLDGHHHRHRKTLFLPLADVTSVETARELLRDEWRRAVTLWSTRPNVVLMDELPLVFTRVACRWAGIDVPAARVESLADELSSMIHYAGSTGPGMWAALARRRATEQWAAELISEVRRGTITPLPQSMLERIADFVDADGERLDLDVAAVELINVLRPTVAVARFVVWAAWALAHAPQWRQRVVASDEVSRAVAQEVRRFAPFFPAVAGRATRTLEWQGHTFEEGAWVLLDIFATNRDPSVWARPDSFDPGRFMGDEPDPNALIPQGAGDVADGHRCPGEDATVALLDEAIRLLERDTDYSVPHQDLGVRMTRMPAAPRSGMVICDVMPVAADARRPA